MFNKACILYDRDLFYDIEPNYKKIALFYATKLKSRVCYSYVYLPIAQMFAFKQFRKGLYIINLIKYFVQAIRQASRQHGKPNSNIHHILI